MKEVYNWDYRERSNYERSTTTHHICRDYRDMYDLYYSCHRFYRNQFN